DSERQERGAEGASGQSAPGVCRASRTRQAPAGVAQQEDVTMRTATAQRVFRVAAVVTLCMAASAAPTASAAPKTHTVTIEGTRFVPETLTVHEGDRVTWVNK